MNHYDIIIVGAGPAGSTAALFAARQGLKVLLVDKAKFPRDKVCGDAISGKSLSVLRKLSLVDKLETLPQTRANGVIFSSPNRSRVSIKFRSAREGETTHGYVCRRRDFDHFLFQQASREVAEVYENFQIGELLQEGHQVKGIRGRKPREEREEDFFAPLVIGADGYKSFVSRALNNYHHDSRHTLIAVRAYFKNVKDLTELIEIHFVKEALPGYFWIFPLPNGYANVGLGMRHIDIKKHRYDLTAILQQVIQSPAFRDRFMGAEAVGKTRGWNLPTGSFWRPKHFDGALLIGDAAGLVDPFTGEGIGNAMTSAEIAIRVARKALAENDVSKERLAEYDRNLHETISEELKLSHRLQTIGRKYPFLLNLVIGKAARSSRVAEWLSSMIAEEESKKELTTYRTYVKLLFS